MSNGFHFCFTSGQLTLTDDFKFFCSQQLSDRDINIPCEINDHKLVFSKILDWRGNHVTHDMKHPTPTYHGVSDFTVKHGILSSIKSFEGMFLECKKVFFIQFCVSLFYGVLVPQFFPNIADVHMWKATYD